MKTCQETPMPSTRRETVRAVTAALLIFFAGLSLIFPAGASAQVQSTGGVSGTVRDPNGAVLPGVQVTIQNAAINVSRTTTTNDEGRFAFPVLPPGTYKIIFTQAGFATTELDNVIVEAAVPRTVEQILQLGQVGETVTVTSDAVKLSTPETATTFRQLNTEQLVQVPTPTRSFTQLLSAEAGVSSDLTPVSVNGTGNVSPNVNGTRTTSTSLFFNGIDATNITSNEGSLSDNISPGPEMLEEVKLQTSLYD